MGKIIEAVKSQLLPTLSPRGLRLLRHHGDGQDEVVDLLFRNVRINLWFEGGYYYVQFGPLFDASWVHGDVVARKVGYTSKLTSTDVGETLQRLGDLLQSKVDQLFILFSLGDGR